MPNENTELLDAEQFKARLMTRICVGDEEGRRILEYLDNIVPNWENMRATLLYKYIQDMLKNAEENKRFEMEIVGKRIVYVIPLLVIFFTAFGYLFYIIYDTYSVIFFGGKPNVFTSINFESNDDTFSYEKGEGLIIASTLIAHINIALSTYLTMVNVHSLREQKNWKYHIEYLQTILGIKLMRAGLEGEIQNLVIRGTNISFSLFLLGFCYILALLSSVMLFDFSFTTIYESSCEPFGLIFCSIDDLSALIMANVNIAFFIFTIFRQWRLISSLISKKYSAPVEVMDMGLLEGIFYYKRKYDEDDDTSK